MLCTVIIVSLYCTYVRRTIFLFRIFLLPLYWTYVNSVWSIFIYIHMYLHSYVHTYVCTWVRFNYFYPLSDSFYVYFCLPSKMINLLTNEFLNICTVYRDNCTVHPKMKKKLNHSQKICLSMTDCTCIVGFKRKMSNFHFWPLSRNQSFLFSYFTSTSHKFNVLYMYGKLSLRALHTYIERCMYWLTFGACFVQIGKIWARRMSLGLESLLNCKKQ